MPELSWRKSTYSAEAANCVEIAPTPTAIHIRDSKDPTGPDLILQPTAWADFVSQLRDRATGDPLRSRHGRGATLFVASSDRGPDRGGTG